MAQLPRRHSRECTLTDGLSLKPISTRNVANLTSCAADAFGIGPDMSRHFGTTSNLSRVGNLREYRRTQAFVVCCPILARFVVVADATAKMREMLAEDISEALRATIMRSNWNQRLRLFVGHRRFVLKSFARSRRVAPSSPARRYTRQVVPRGDLQIARPRPTSCERTYPCPFHCR